MSDSTNPAGLQETSPTLLPPPQLLEGDIGFKMDWKNRRKVVYLSLLGTGGLFSLTLFCLIGQMFWGDNSVDVNLINAIQSAMFLLLTCFISIAGGYLFGVQFDLNSLRSNMVSLVSTINKKS